MNRNQAIAAYRNAWRATGQVFNNDLKTLLAARTKIREGFEEDRHSILDNQEFKEKVDHINNVASFLRQNIVQAEQQASETYRLNITKDTELGNNEDIKTGKSTLGSQGFTGCCGGGGNNARPNPSSA